MSQLSFQFGMNEPGLRACLERAAKKNISLIITDNSSTMLSVKSENGAVSLRLHRIFLEAGRDVIEEIAGFISNSRRKTPLLTEFIRSNIHLVKGKPRRKIRVKARGRHHDLARIYREVNEKYFEGRISSAITWGSRAGGRKAARRTLGSYSYHSDIIRISPVLDSKTVPGYFLRFIVYHEMLHADVGVKDNRERRSIHSREFKRRERLFEQYERAIAWEKKRWG